jgi:hypothetical protein
MPRAKGGSIPPPRVNVEPNHGGIISDLNENDVLCGRGGRINNHPGNITFRVIVEEFKREYLDPRTRKLEKAHVAARLVAQIRSANPPGRFLKDDPNNAGMYFEIGDVKAWKSELSTAYLATASYRSLVYQMIHRFFLCLLLYLTSMLIQ